MKLKVSKVTDSDKYYLFNLDNPQEKADFELLSSITEASHAKEIDKDVDYEARVPQEFNCIAIFQKLGGIAKATAVDDKDVYVEVSHGLPVGYDLAQLYFPVGALRRQADNSTKFVIQQYADGKPLFKAGYPRTTLAANAYSAGAYNPDNHTSIFDTLDVRELECSVCGKARKNRKNFNVFKGFSNQEVVMVGNECYSEFRQNHVANTDVISSLGKLEQLEEHMAQYEKPADFLNVLKQKDDQTITSLTQTEFPRTEVVDEIDITNYLNQVIHGNQPINARISEYTSPIKGVCLYEDNANVLVVANKTTRPIPEARIREVVQQFFYQPAVEFVHGEWCEIIKCINSVTINPNKSAQRNYEDANTISNALSAQQHIPYTIIATYDVDSDEIKYSEFGDNQFDEALATIINKLKTKYQSEINDNQTNK